MKLKYKKIVVLISACALGIALVAFSAANPNSKNAGSKATIEQTTATTEDGSDSTNEADALQDAVAAENTDAAKKMETTTEDSSTARVATNETSEDNVLLKNEYKAVNKLIKKYLTAKLTAKVENFDGLVNDTSMLTAEDLERQTNYIEDYSNVEVYTKKGPEEGSLVVYAYHEVKFTSIETLAPAMNMFYVKSDADGNYYIYIGNVDDETADFFDQVNESDDVMELIYEVNDKMKDAVDSDKDLEEFYTKLEETAKQVAQNE